MRVVAALGAAIALAAAALPGAAPAAPQTLLAVLADPAQRQLVRVDARTLVPVGGRLPLGVISGPFVRSPDGTQLAVGAGPGITYIDPGRMQRIGDMVLKPDPNLVILGWPQDHLLFAQACCQGGVNYLRIVDPRRLDVAGRVPLTFDINGTATSADAVVFLASATNVIEPARIEVYGPGVDESFGPLARIPAGRHWHKVHGRQVLELRQPGFTVDPERRIAYVIASPTLAAEVDLRTGAIAYHTIAPAPRSLARVEKEFNGTTRVARWLGDGKIAVAGSRFAVGKKSTPAGVALLDTTTWRTQVLDAQAAGFVTDGTYVLALKLHTVEAFTKDGVLRLSLPVNDALLYAQVFDGMAYVWTDTSVTVVDLDAARVVAKLPRPELYLVGSD